MSRTFWKLPLFAACIAALMLYAAAGAAGAVRFAAPGASGGEPCNPNPCSLRTAVNEAGDGDQVIVAPGSYSVGGELLLDRAENVGGQPGAPPPSIELATKSLSIANAGAVLHDLRVHMVGPAMANTMVLEAGTVERVYASSGENGASCQIIQGLLRDSVCRDALYVGSGEPGSFTAVVRNVTASPMLVIACCGANVTLDAANVIAYATRPEDDDLTIDSNVMASVRAVLTHSNYSTVSTSASAGKDFTYTPPGTNGNQMAKPLFVNAAAGDFHELPGSPTIDAGVSDPLIGATDLDGIPRSQPPCVGGSPVPDIGAYESTPTIACPKPPNLFSFGKLKRNRKKGTAKLAVSVPGAGTLTLSGKGVGKATRAVSSAGSVKLLIDAKGKRERALERRGTVKLTVKVTFTPTGGDPATQTKTVKLIKRR
jgi:hypothetical protein